MKLASAFFFVIQSSGTTNVWREWDKTRHGQFALQTNMDENGRRRVCTVCTVHIAWRHALEERGLQVASWTAKNIYPMQIDGYKTDQSWVLWSDGASLTQAPSWIVHVQITDFSVFSQIYFHMPPFSRVNIECKLITILWRVYIYIVAIEKMFPLHICNWCCHCFRGVRAPACKFY